MQKGQVRLTYTIPSRGLIGFSTDFMTMTKGYGIINHTFKEYMAMNDYAFFKMSGVYSNGILINGSFIPYSTITCFPILQLPQEEQEKYDHSSLVISTTKKPTVTLLFASEEECKQAVEKMIEMKPELKTW